MFITKNYLYGDYMKQGCVNFVSASNKYDIVFSISYGAGLLGSLAYMRMLGKTVDSMADGAKGLIK